MNFKFGATENVLSLASALGTCLSVSEAGCMSWVGSILSAGNTTVNQTGTSTLTEFTLFVGETDNKEVNK